MSFITADAGEAGAMLDYATPRTGARGVSHGAGFVPVGRPLSIRWLAFVAMFCATMLLPTLGGRRVLTRHEVFAAEPAREMLHGGSWVNWVIPHFAGIPRTVKPPTTGWFIAGSMALFHSEAEWVVRLPSALSAIVMTLLVADLAARWLGPRVGVIAGLMQATFVYMVVQARLAEADMPMAAAVCLAMYAFARGVVQQRGSSLLPAGPRRRGRGNGAWLPVVFYLGAGWSFLLKGVGIAFILAAVAAFIACSALEGRDWRRCLRFLVSPAGLLLLVVLLVAWPVAAWRVDPNIFKTFRRELLGRASGDLGERQPWYFYAGVVPFMLMPWLPFGIGPMIHGLRRGVPRGPVGQFLLCWFVPGLLILSASAWKHHHYVIPMLPPATLVMAAGVDHWFRTLKRQNPWVGVLPWLIGCAIAAALVWRFEKTGRDELVATLALLAIGGAIVLYVARSRWAMATAVAVFATAWTVSFAVGFAIIPAFEDYRWSVELAKRVNYEVPPGKPIYLLNLKEHNTAFYLRWPIARVDSNVDQWFRGLDHGQYFALCPAWLLPTLKDPNDTLMIPCSDVTVLDRSAGLHKTDTEDDRPLLVEINVLKLLPAPPMPRGY